MQWIIDSKKKDTKLPEIIRAAVQLFVEKGIESTTTKQIAEHAQVAEGTLYRHFTGKEEMAYQIFITHLEAFSHELTKAASDKKGTREKLRALIESYFTFFEMERDLFEYVVLYEHKELRKYPEGLKQPLHVVMKVIEEGIKEGDIPAQDVTLSAAFIIGMVHRVSVFRIYKRIQDNLSKYIDSVTDACVRVLS